MANQMPDKSSRRNDYLHFLSLQTRWNDLDSYGHLNNARYYAFLDSAIMDYLQVLGGFDLVHGPVLPFTIENGCRFFQSFTFPDTIEVGLRVTKIGRSSIRYEMGLFKQGHTEIRAAAYFVDVFVDATSQTPIQIPTALRKHLQHILWPQQPMAADD